MRNLKNSLIIVIVILVVIALGYLLEYYDFKNMLIILGSVLIGGYVGSRFITN